MTDTFGGTGGGATGAGSLETLNASRALRGDPPIALADYEGHITGPAYATMDPDAQVWDAGTLYPARAAVRHADALWVAAQATQGTEPGTNAAVWMLQLEGVNPQAIYDEAQIIADAGVAAAAAQVTLAQGSAAAAQTAETGAVAARVAAEVARDETSAAAATVGRYASTAAGLADTSAGDTFWVYASEYLVLYRHDAGPVAFDTGIRLPLASALDAETNDRYGADIRGGTIRLINIGGTGDAITADVPTEQAHIPLDVSVKMDLRIQSANSGPVTLTVTHPVGGAKVFALETMGGQPLPAGALQESATLRLAITTTSVARVTAPLTAAELTETETVKILTAAERADNADTRARLGPAVFEPLAPESGYAWAVLDGAGRRGLGLTRDGKLVTDLSPDATVPVGALDAEAMSRLAPEGVDQSRMSAETGYLWAVTDADGRIGMGLRADGAFWFRPGADVEFPADAVQGLLPGSDIVCWGDSMTAGSGASTTTYRYPEALALALGRTVANRGIGGQGSAQIAARAGGLPVTVTVSGNSIPASGPVDVTAISPAILTSGSSTGTLTGTGTLAGVHGTLSKTGNPAVYTFTRTAAGSVTACPSGSVYTPDEAEAFEADIAIIWAGRNDNRGSSGATQRGYFAGTRDAILSMVARLTPLAKRVLILPVFNGRAVAVAGGAYEPSGSTAHSNILLINQELARTFGDRFLADLRPYMVRDAIYDLGLTPTADDLADMAADCIPRQLFADDLHLNDYRPVANYIARAIKARGW